MKPQNLVYTGLICLAIASIVCNLAMAEDWPTYQHDNQRSGVTSEHLNLPLGELWRYTSRHEAQPAWPAPAKQDFWNRIQNLNPLVTYDRAFHVVVAGDSLYFASSADDKVYCLDASTGDERWSFFTEGPVRLAPSVFAGKIYAGSDDGFVYCLEASDGKLAWKYKAAGNDRRVPGNDRMISIRPVRTGVLVEDGIVYFCAGLFPKERVYMCALNAENGSEIWVNGPDMLSPQGYLLASPTRLYVPTGRTTPVVFGRRDGRMLGSLSSPRAEGGTYALLLKGSIISGPGTRLRELDPNTGGEIATFAGRHIIVADGLSYLLSYNDELSAIDRSMHSVISKQRAERKKLADELSDMRKKRETLNGEFLEELDAQISETEEKLSALGEQLKGKTEYKWRSQCQSRYSMILADDILFAGGDDRVDAFSTADGKLLWTGAVIGKAYGLAVANGSLFVSTDKGTIHCFSSGEASRTRIISPPEIKSPYPQSDLSEVYASAAEQIISETGIDRGYCLVLGSGEGRLVYELARRTELRIIGVEENREKALAARQKLDEAGLYGSRVTIHYGPLKRLPYTDCFANLIVSDSLMVSGNMPTPVDEVFRVLRPFGGVAYLGQTVKAAEIVGNIGRSRLEKWLGKAAASGWEIMERNGLWAMMRRGPIPGSGEWTHQYADAGNTACSGDRLVQNSMQVQWFGRPGPRQMIDRHNRAMAPLWKDGRLFVPAAGENRVIAMDAYNGATLWDVEVPNYTRVGANRDAGNMVVTDDYLYVATEDKCWGLDVATGEHLLTFKAPQLDSEQRYWGYIASTGDLLFGSGQKKDASFTEQGLAAIGELYYDNKPIATSDYLFCLNRRDGSENWRYKNGTIINSAIAIGDRRIYFVESRNPASAGSGRIKLDELLANGYLVALDKRTGSKEWERQVNLPFEHVIHLSYANDTVLIVGTGNEGNHPRYDLHAFNADDGSVKWSNHYVRTDQSIDGGHGEQDQHPVIVGDSIYLIGASDYSLRTGKSGSYKLDRGGHGCGTLSGSMAYLFARGGNPRMYEITGREENGDPLTYVNRPGCWINIIPAGGLVSIPEFSSGCTCSYPIQTSIVLMPKADR